MPSTRPPRSHLDDGGLPIMLFASSDSDSEAEIPVPTRNRNRKQPEVELAPEQSRIETTEAMRKTPADNPPSNSPPVPRHPIPSMQDAFRESLVEATQSGVEVKPKLRIGDVKSRREELLDQDKSAPAPAALWRYRPGQECHELRRLMAQISFGVYLLLNGLANSQISVVGILQGHIDEVDEFLETTLEDMALANKDLSERIDFLKLPMDNMQVFEQMLEDRNFRLQILNGNEKIEHIVSRTETALIQNVTDLSEGTKSTKEFMLYLAEQQHGQWRVDRPDVIDIFEAMKGNTDGWYSAFIELQAKGNALNALILKLNRMVADIECKAGEVSRRMRFSVQPFTATNGNSRQSPVHSPQNSEGSIETPSSSGLVSNSPPRLSLRLSTVPTSPGSEPSYFDMPFDRNSALVPDFQFSGNEIEEEPIPAGSPPMRNPARMSARLPVPKLATPDEHDEDEHKDDVQDDASEAPQEDQSDGETDEPEAEPVYLLQPRTYTPQPPSRAPSPNLVKEKSKPKVVDTSRPEVDPLVPRIEPLRVGVASPVPPVDSHRVRVEQARPRVVSLTSRGEPLKAPPMPRTEPPKPPTRNMSQNQDTQSSLDSDSQTQPKKRTSLRQRVSLKTTPPESIQVPPPNAPELQRPVFPSPQRYQGPDSAYGSDIERPTLKSMVSREDTDLADISPPTLGPHLVPSPHSDRQFFRPVQASPHSPLQQRPHTSHTLTAPPVNTAYHQHQRNIPSRMGGASMLSNVTTMTNETGTTNRTLKKKRSAFGWLKKAFTLDEEERAAFERKRQQTMPSQFYEARSPQFLDGRRVRPPQAY